MQKELKDYSETELKALAYENVQQLEQCKVNLNIINQELQRRALQEQEKPVEFKTHKAK